MNNKFLVLITINLLLLVGSVSGQSRKKVVNDTIFRLGGRQIVCQVQKVHQYDIDYKFLNDPTLYSIEKKQVQKIVWRTGKIEEFSAPVMMMIDETSWEAVLVTDNKEDVRGMYKYGSVFAASSPGAKSKKKAINTATIKLQKKTSNLKGNVVLIVKKEPRGGYGEMPSYYLEGEAYGYVPLPEEEVDDSKESLNDVLR